ncbi:P-loop containing nucleoside triphosphate hydrolase protein [Pelagophyceae sp. CCMP2097]|nr:P-loop containing nucleoside triphosphate hydrolase protein [Pelagophyceae sp. CCMP2097]
MRLQRAASFAGLLWQLWAAAAAENATTPSANSTASSNAASATRGPALEWSDVSATVSARMLIAGIHGRAEPGRLHAIMGPSGSGKSTLLNAIAGRVKQTPKLKLRGDVLVDGVRSDRGALGAAACRCAYVPQQDLFYPLLTVRETLLFSARLRLPRSMPLADKEKLVDDVLGKMGLAKVSGTLVGDAKVRGISGGERKRLAIACELIDDPNCLFLDEPTSGLDSFAAEKVCRTLKSLADQGRTVVCVIHQPSSTVFDLFDDLTIVSEGELVYHGAVAEVDDTFRSLGFPRPSSASRAEHAVETVSVDYESPATIARSRATLDLFAVDAATIKPRAAPANLLSLGTAYTAAARNRLRSSLGAAPVVLPTPTPARAVSKRSETASVLEQYRLLFSRAWRDVVRARTPTLIKAFQQIMTALIYGGIYSLDSSQQSIQDRFGLLSLCVIGACNLAVATTIRAFPKEKAIVLTERAAKMYGAFPYLLSKIVAELPVAAALSALFGCVVYPLAGLRRGGKFFLNFLGLNFLNTMASGALGLLVGAAAPSTDAALALFPPLIVLMIIFNGSNIADESTPQLLRWLPRLSLVRWGFEALACNEMRGLEFVPRGAGPQTLTGEEALRRLSFEKSTVKRAALAQAGIGLACYAQTYRILRNTTPKFAKFEHRILPRLRPRGPKF